MEKAAIEYYIKGYVTDTLSQAEREFFFNEVIKEENRDVYQEVAASLLEDDPAVQPFDEKLWPIFNRVLQVDKPYVVEQPAIPSVRRIHFPQKWWWAAASVLLLSTAGIYFWMTSGKKDIPAANIAAAPADIPPGRNGAILTLADGTKVVLDSLGNGVVATQKGAKVVLKDGKLTYQAAEKAPGEMVYNTMSTPKGRQFQIALPDGSRVWLNAASSVTYPTVFTGRDRTISISGEAYLEIAQDKHKPFIVKTDRSTIEVLGTSFNINAYSDEDATKTTLIEGSVKIISGPSEAILKPGSQASVHAGRLDVDKTVNIDQVMAWKNGLFNFNDLDLRTVMRELSRWYDIDVVYEEGVVDRVFGGEMQKDVPLSDVLHFLKALNIQFQLEGRRLLIRPSKK